jgi:hypothetical protein
MQSVTDGRAQVLPNPVVFVHLEQAVEDRLALVRSQQESGCQQSLGHPHGVAEKGREVGIRLHAQMFPQPVDHVSFAGGYLRLEFGVVGEVLGSAAARAYHLILAPVGAGHKVDGNGGCFFSLADKAGLGVGQVVEEDKADSLQQCGLASPILAANGVGAFSQGNGLGAIALGVFQIDSGDQHNMLRG